MIKLEDRVHPFSGSVKGSQHPQFSLETRTTKRTNSLETLIFNTFTPPDEEKGRKFKSSLTAPSLFFNNINATTTTTIVNTNREELVVAQEEENDDDSFEKGWFEERKDNLSLGSAWNDSMLKPTKPTNWTSALSASLECASGGNGNIELSSLCLVDIPDQVGELSLLTNINNTSMNSPERMFSRVIQGRTASGPLEFNRRSPRQFIRSSSGPLNSSVLVDFYLSNNQITSESISHALWSVKNTRVLTLRSNALTYLPEGIGRLENLNTLNIGANQISFLPSEILLLKNLLQLNAFPNPFLAPPKPLESESSDKKYLVTPTIVHFKFPSLTELCIRSLLSLRQPFSKPTPFPAHLLSPFLTTFDAVPPRSNSNSQPFDPLSNICRSPLHPEEEISFYKPAVERMQWVSQSDILASSNNKMKEVLSELDLKKKNSSRDIPIRHRGCSLHCLDWLDE